MADEGFRVGRLARLYDGLEGERGDLDAYVRLVGEVGARRVADVGCGTGTFAVLLAGLGVEVVGVEPAAASLAVARGKDGGGRVRWVEGDAGALPASWADLVTMTANVAQEISEPAAWRATLRGAYAGLRPGGLLAFETRVPALRVWEGWNRVDSYAVTDIPGVGSVESWVEVTRVAGALVSFRRTYVFADGRIHTSDSTLRFRERDEVADELADAGFALEDVRDAPDRPGREYVFLARRPSSR